MSVRIGVISEGPIDLAIITPLLRAVASDRVGLRWPVQPEDAAKILQMRPRGYGGVWRAVQRMVDVLNNQAGFPYEFVVILLDYRTRNIQHRVRKLIAGSERFILAVAKEEIEAWWIGDRLNTLTWLGFSKAPSKTRYAVPNYHSERDENPKRTLHELTERSDKVDRLYGEGNLDLALDFANRWEGHVRLDDILNQCPKRFTPFCKDATQAFRRARSLPHR